MSGEPFIIREPDLDNEIPALVRLYNAIEAAVGDPEPTTEAMLRARLAWPDQCWLVAEAPAGPAALICRANTVVQTAERRHLHVMYRFDLR